MSFFAIFSFDSCGLERLGIRVMVDLGPEFSHFLFSHGFSLHSYGKTGGSLRNHCIQPYYFRDMILRQWWGNAIIWHLKCCYSWSSHKHICFSVIKTLHTSKVPVLQRQCHEGICSFHPHVSSEAETASWVGRQRHTGKSIPTTTITTKSPNTHFLWKLCFSGGLKTSFHVSEFSIKRHTTLRRKLFWVTQIALVHIQGSFVVPMRQELPWYDFVIKESSQEQSWNELAFLKSHCLDCNWECDRLATLQRQHFWTCSEGSLPLTVLSQACRAWEGSCDFLSSPILQWLNNPTWGRGNYWMENFHELCMSLILIVNSTFHQYEIQLLLFLILTFLKLRCFILPLTHLFHMWVHVPAMHTMPFCGGQRTAI